MAIALVSSVESTPGADGGASSSIDTSGASLLVIHTSSFAAVSGVSDSKGNTWVPLTVQTVMGERYSRLWYAVNPTVGSGHTFTVSGTGIYPHVVAAAFSGVNTSSPFDAENGATGNGTSTLATGSVTPGEDGELLVTGICAASSEPTIDSGFSIIQSAATSGGVNMSGALGYKVQTSAGAANPTWSLTANNCAATIATFKAAGGGGSKLLLRLQEDGLFVGSAH